MLNRLFLKKLRICLFAFSHKTNLYEPIVNRALKSLKEKNILKREGSKKDGFLKVEKL